MIVYLEKRRLFRRRSEAHVYGLSKERGVAVIEEVVAALEGWVAVAQACGLNSSQIERMRSAFEHPERLL